MIKIVDYKAGNAPSVMHAVNRLGLKAEFARSEKDLDNASYVILPGVGSAGATMVSLKESGLINAIENAVLKKKLPFLGICVGMQSLFEKSEEDNANCLGWLKGDVVKFDTSKVRVPQMGWNKTEFVKEVPFETEDNYFYFVNSFYAKPKDKCDLWGVSE
jgi:glutamine amidotransferase